MPKTRRLSDAALVRRSQQGDRRSFSALLSRYDWRLRGLAHALLLDQGEMDVALGTAYLRAWRDVVRIGPRDDVAAWLYRVAYNACIDQLRRSDGQPASAPASAPSVTLGLAALPAAHRVAVVLVDREGFSTASAARIMGLPHGELVATLEQARDELSSHLPEAGAVRPPADGPGTGEPPDPSAFDASASTTATTGPGAAGGGEPRDPTDGDARSNGTEGAGDRATADGAEAEIEAEAEMEAEAQVKAEAEMEADADADRAPVAVGAPRHATVDHESDRDTTRSGTDDAAGGDGASAAGEEPAGAPGRDAVGGNGASAAGEVGAPGSNGEAGDGSAVEDDESGNGSARGNGSAGTPADADAQPTSAAGAGGGVEGNGRSGNGADPNRGKGRRARKKAKHAAQRARAEGVDGRDGGSG